MERKRDEDNMKLAEKKLSSYVSKWQVKKIELSLDNSKSSSGKKQKAMSTARSTNADAFSDFSGECNSAREEVEDDGKIVIKRRNTKRKFPLRKKITKGLNSDYGGDSDAEQSAL